MLNLMLLLRKIFMQFIFPPGIIIIAILLLYFLLIYRKKKIATIFTVFLVTLLFLLSSWLGEHLFLKPLEDKYILNSDIFRDRVNFSHPLIVVLAGDLVTGSLSAGVGNAEVGEITLVRLLGAYFLYKKMECPILVSGGTVPGFAGNIPAADSMKQLLVDLGIPAEDIIKETQSSTTLENASFTMGLIRRYGFQEVILVTSAVHMPRAMFAFQNDDILIFPAPVDFLYENIHPGILNLLPNRSSWEHNLRALHEWIGLFYYKLLL
jgi:uncharacterized SAM-binding protein YcdF (DUF218 family)